ncbi:hypothetical protein Tco_1455669 [Tanacetum coccineum]
MTALQCSQKPSKCLYLRACAQVPMDRTQAPQILAFHYDKIPKYFDSKAAIAISCNPDPSFPTKHIGCQISLQKEQTKIELTLEQSQQGVSNDVLVTKKGLKENEKEMYDKGINDGVAASFQRSRIHKPHAHTQAFKVNRSTSR